MNWLTYMLFGLFLLVAGCGGTSPRPEWNRGIAYHQDDRAAGQREHDSSNYPDQAAFQARLAAHVSAVNRVKAGGAAPPCFGNWCQGTAYSSEALLTGNLIYAFCLRDQGFTDEVCRREAKGRADGIGQKKGVLKSLDRIPVCFDNWCNGQLPECLSTLLAGNITYSFAVKNDTPSEQAKALARQAAARSVKESSDSTCTPVEDLR